VKFAKKQTVLNNP